MRGSFSSVTRRARGRSAGAGECGCGRRPTWANHETGLQRPLLCRIAHSDKLLQRWFLAPWTMKHSEYLASARLTAFVRTPSRARADATIVQSAQNYRTPASNPFRHTLIREQFCSVTVDRLVVRGQWPELATVRAAENAGDVPKSRLPSIGSLVAPSAGAGGWPSLRKRIRASGRRVRKLDSTRNIRRGKACVWSRQSPR